ncbi:DUF721 domain-containing protein [Verrucomicrobiota bacterium]
MTTCTYMRSYQSKSQQSYQHDPNPIGQVIAQVMKKLGLKDQHWLGVLAAEWPDIVGDAVAKHTKPGRFENKRLFVFVDSSVWLNELARYSHSKILSNIQKRFGSNNVKSIQLQLDPGE